MKQFELIIPKEVGHSEIINHDVNWYKEKALDHHIKKWCIAPHGIEKGYSFEHFHLGIELCSNMSAENIAKWFDLPPNCIQKIGCHFETSYPLYLIHYGYDDKEPIPIDLCTFSWDIDWNDLKAKRDRLKATDDKMDTLISDILNGKIHEYEIYSDIELNERIISSGMSGKVRQALSDRATHRAMENTRSNENMKMCYWIYGNAGTGKTTLAHGMFKNQYCYVTSSGKNPFDNYRGEPVVILDDIDKDTVTSKAILKLLDNFNDSMTACRYNNKFIDSDYFVITSTVSPFEWWKSVADEKSDGNVYQLYRRLNGGIFHFLPHDKTKIEITTFDGQGNNEKHGYIKMPSYVLEVLANQTNESEKRLTETVNRFGFEMEFGDCSAQVTLKLEPQGYADTPTDTDGFDDFTDGVDENNPFVMKP